MMNDRIISTIRTLVPSLYGIGLTWLIAQWPAVQDALDWLSEQFGTDVRLVISGVLTAGVIAAYYWLVRTIAERFPAAGKWIERLGLGSSKTPVYEAKHRA